MANEESNIEVGNFARPKRSRRFKLITAGVVLLVLLLLGGLIWFTLLRDNSEKKLDGVQRANLQSVANAKKPVVAGRKDASYYVVLGQAYEKNGQTTEALNAYEQANKVMTKAERDDGLSINMSLASLYAKTGKKELARQYYQKEIDRIKASEDAADNQEVIKAIQQLKDDI